MKKLISTILCVAFALSLCGCNNNPSKQSSNSVVEFSSKENFSNKEQNSSQKEEKPQSSQKQETPSSSAKMPSVVTHVTDNDHKPIDETEYFWGSVTAYISSNKVRALPSGMTYRQIIEALGKSSSAGYIREYYEYVVDDDNLLILRFDDSDDVCELSGEQLLKTIVPLKSHLNDDKKGKVYAIVIDDYLKVTCPTYKDFNCADIITKNAKITFSNGKSATKDDIKKGKAIIFTYDIVLDSYPPQVYAKEIIIQ